MRSLIFLLIAIAINSNLVLAQTEFKVPRLEKIAIGESGVFAYFPKSAEPIQFTVDFSLDSSKVYTGSTTLDGFEYTIILVELDYSLTDNLEKEELLVAYLDFLQQQFEIDDAAGYGKGHTLASDANTVGIIDYWATADGEEYKIKGWADNNHIAVLFIVGATAYPNMNVQEMFLNGIRFK